jgi:hypothetical protein
MRKLLNALVDKVGPLGGGGGTDTGTPQNIYVVAADSETGFIGIYHAQADLSIGTKITSDEDL